jgi:hypothetical protein
MFAYETRRRRIERRIQQIATERVPVTTPRSVDGCWGCELFASAYPRTLAVKVAWQLHYRETHLRAAA